jgi:hypothetical protein
MFDAMSMRHIFMKITTCLALPLILRLRIQNQSTNGKLFRPHSYAIFCIFPDKVGIF